MNFTDNGQGTLRKNLSGEATYYSFVPAPLHDIFQISLDDNIIRSLAECSRMIGELEGMIRFVPNAAMYLTMYVRKEALVSAQIEGTQCTFDDLLNPDNSKLHHREIADVVNYVKAVSFAKNRMEELPLCTRLLRETHKILIAGGRGIEKRPGEIRGSQNWIGSTGSTISTASYIPPNPEDMKEALSELDSFINDEDIHIDPIVKAALIHYQFETIHPFLDGNGRLGRMLITLSLLNDNVLSDVIFYPSFELKLRRREYYDALTAVRERGDYSEWVAFFIDCLLASASDAVSSLNKMVELHNRNTQLIADSLARSSSKAQQFLELLEEHPIIDSSMLVDKLEISKSTASSLIKSFEKLGILIDGSQGKQRYKTYLYEDYLNILRTGGEPL